MSDLVGHPEDRFSRVAAHMMLKCSGKVIIKHAIFGHQCDYDKGVKQNTF